ncbi:KUP/HAK/KT family potassium transporter [Candidatus Peregrinibacteria bacterium]|nr:KUP/HAK/KT family potassium transporter [Candidatus Peregrinibacteria bacterium]
MANQGIEEVGESSPPPKEKPQESPGHHHGHGHNDKGIKAFLLLCLAASGVVYGDIGTSILYTFKEIFFPEHGIGQIVNETSVLGSCSLIFWTLTLVVCLKYVVLVLRADNLGEGGTFSLLALFNGMPGKAIGGISLALVLAASFLYGEGLITPAISVLSAIEGLEVATPALKPAVIPLTIAILTGLFAVQYKGTAKVGTIFGGVMVVWFIVVAILGINQIIKHPEVLRAVNPYYGYHFMMQIGFSKCVVVLGSVVLCMTGGEALYADMGHFGKQAIRISWLSFVFPCLLLNYFGQGAKLLSGEPIPHNNPFFSLVPSWGIYPMVALATAATVIASQALISGAFSLTHSGINLNLLPRMKVVHTSQDVEGQIYMPGVNWALWAGCVLLVLGFRSSSNLASAYGMAVTGVMTTTTVSMYFIATRKWNWRWQSAALVFGFFGIIDLAYLGSNAAKFFQGGFIPFIIGLVLFFIMTTWRMGRRMIQEAYARVISPTIDKLIEMKADATELKVAVVVMASRPIKALTDQIPMVHYVFWQRWRSVPRHIIYFSVVTEKVPYVEADHRYEIFSFYDDKHGGTCISILMHVGYMEQPDVRAALKYLKDEGKIRIHQDRWTVLVGKEEIFVDAGVGFITRFRAEIFRFMHRIATQAHTYFGLSADAGVSLELIPVQFHDATTEVAPVSREAQPLMPLATTAGGRE